MNGEESRRARTRNDRIADLPYRCNESKGPASTGPTLNTRMQIRLAGNDDLLGKEQPTTVVAPCYYLSSPR